MITQVLAIVPDNRRKSPDQKCSTILEVAVDRHELMTLQHIMWPYITRNNE